MAKVIHRHHCGWQYNPRLRAVTSLVRGMLANNLVGLGFLSSVSYRAYDSRYKAIPTHENELLWGDFFFDQNEIFNPTILALGKTYANGNAKSKSFISKTLLSKNSRKKS